MDQIISTSSPGITLVLRRDDLFHPLLSGNKYRKLKYNIAFAREQGFTKLLSFGGAYSNHIAALAGAGCHYGFDTIGIIRGEELQGLPLNHTLRTAQQNGMQLEFVSRLNYKNKESASFVNFLRGRYGNFYLLPEGGTNALAVRGCEEILSDADGDFDYICCAVGTGGTISGIVNKSAPKQKVIGFLASGDLKVKSTISAFSNKENWRLLSAYNFGGYGKINTQLIQFLNDFYQSYHIPLDPLYTGKMMFGIIDLINTGFFGKEAKILVIHTGGLQGIAGMNENLKSKKLPLITYG